MIAGAFFEPEWTALALFAAFALAAVVVVTPLIALTWTMTKVVFITTLLVLGVLAGFSFLAFDLPLAAYAVVTAANVVSAPYVGVAWALMHRTLARIEEVR